MPSVSVPQPKKYGPLGNLPHLDLEKPTQSLVKLAEEYGPIFRMEYAGRSELYISSEKYVAEASDESRFDKRVWAPLAKVRAFAGDGLFTSRTDEPNWKKAHNVLLPSFSQRAMQGYHTKMVDLAVQLVQKWARLNPDETVNVPQDMTRLTLDTIGLCGFNYRFNSFYREEPHPFIGSMVRALDESMSSLQRLPLQDKLMFAKKKQFEQDIRSMFELVDHIIAERKAHPQEDADDLLSHMLSGKDPETGETLDDENIRYQIITFLIAGHETTSGLLSFAVYYLMKNPDKLAKAQAEADRILKDPVPTYNQVRQLKYVRMVLNEALRLWPTAPAFSLYAKEDTVLGGQYPLQKGDSVNVLIPRLHRDKEAWGHDVEEFRPERFEDPSKVPHNAYKPFGNGQRACIGQQFALQEAALVLGMVLKHFDFIDHMNYQLDVKESLTLKPDHFIIRVRARGGQPVMAVPGGGGAVQESTSAAKKSEMQAVYSHDTPLLVLYGSNLGTAEGIAREIADTATYQGFRSEVAALDERVGTLPKEGAVVIVSASYNGQPPSNAKKFVEWIEQADSDAFKGVKYTVLGCGDHNWASTYQRIPRLIDEHLSSRGAKRLSSLGESDASGDFEKQVEDWTEQLWPDLARTLELKLNTRSNNERSSLSVQFVTGMAVTPLVDTYNAHTASIVENRELHDEGSERSTRHLEIQLPEGITYKEGDHLGKLPKNSPELVERVLRRYGFTGAEHLVLDASGRSAAHLPLQQPVNLYDLLSHSVELQEAATRAQLRELAAYTVCPPHKKELEALLDESLYMEKVRNKRISMLDFLEKYEACELPFERFLELLPSLKARYYSISSSPQVQSTQASITVSVVQAPAWNGKGIYKGVASNYLAGLEAGDEVVMFVRTPESGFQLPERSEVPIIMVGPGTGVAPFRGFLQARYVMKQQGQKIGEAHLYFGCRNPEHDYLYKNELEAAEQEGLVQLHTAFSRIDGQEKCYVQHRMKQDAQLLIPLLESGAHLYICGDGSHMAPDVEATLKQAYADVRGKTSEEAQVWFEQLEEQGRYAKDVWAGN
ncbi:bifunctional cytochrome P450/NADPH--P450 reductase [Paenibacillus silvae]|uniref:bifunctional cytochrome P450/NADPH--P450 reductase n=1 Tax=Paenibacillus silvae TaxID=1325358 RepID=UPI002006581B|nr:bifunctional cytochrome P450/NADPH--P450 reductase [Paenibacillus silvae]MCK6073792.1 bifunctional cytochrome P450/NADPH--P450 reductase [Paenibacillus silvae]MCK6148732.1 bifunctional cytochrome P450/NADPH--P450 reductase [Paenibacillus silvae]MCK6267032.1 bifunctional cytochrome P450/NADPH--P450 reductase [Paenibacillus silvae]